MTIWRTQQPDPWRLHAGTRHGRPPGLHGLHWWSYTFSSAVFFTSSPVLISYISSLISSQGMLLLFSIHLSHKESLPSCTHLQAVVCNSEIRSHRRESCTLFLHLSPSACPSAVRCRPSPGCCPSSRASGPPSASQQNVACQTLDHVTEWHALDAVAVPAITLRNMTKQRQSHRIEDWSTFWRCSQQERLPDDSLATVCLSQGTRTR